MRADAPEPPSADPRARWGFTPALGCALLVGILLRLVGLDDFPPPVLDEGGWPYSVREWATAGTRTFDFHTAPGYHLLLGAFFAVVEPTMANARLLSALLAVGTLGLFWWMAHRLTDDARLAAWATVLWACCFPAIDIARRALIEPFQMPLILGLVLALTVTGAAAVPLVVVLTCALLLTKANAIVLLPAFAIALWWDRAAVLHARRLPKLLAMGGGTALAAGVFYLLYRSDPATFVQGWSPTLKKTFLESDAPVLRLGRFVLDPQLVQSGLDFVATQTPFLFGLGVIGAVRAMRERTLTVAGGWVLLLLPFLLLQVIQTPQYFSVLYPAFALVAAGVLLEMTRRVGGTVPWPIVALVLVLLDGVGRATAAQLFTRRPDTDTVTWVRAQVPADATILAAPFLLMQWSNPGVSLFTFGEPPFAPNADAVRATGAEWLVIDEPEWQARLAKSGIDSAAVADTLEACCTLVHADRYAWVYRVRPTP